MVVEVVFAGRWEDIRSFVLTHSVTIVTINIGLIKSFLQSYWAFKFGSHPFCSSNLRHSTGSSQNVPARPESVSSFPIGGVILLKSAGNFECWFLASTFICCLQ